MFQIKLDRTGNSGENAEQYLLNRVGDILRGKSDTGSAPSSESASRVTEILSHSNVHTVEFKPLYLLERYKEEAGFSEYVEETSSLIEKASNAPVAFTVLLRASQIKQEKKNPNLLIAAGWKNFVPVGSVAGCVSLAIRLKDVPEEKRTEVELQMRESLKEVSANSERLYTDCYHYVTQSLTEIPRSDRGQELFTLISKWVFMTISKDKEVADLGPAIEDLAVLYRNETVGYWTSR